MTKEGAKKTLLKNTAYLYALTFSSQLINLCTIPYQTRVLTPELYGIVGFAISLMNIVSLVLNFGFLYSATQAVAEQVQDKTALSRIYTAVAILKTVIGILLVIALIVCSLFIGFLSEHMTLIMLYFLGYFLAALLPDFLYRGIEMMSAITIRTVLVRVLSAALIFVFLKSDADVLVLPMSMVLGNFLALVFCFNFDSKKLGVKFCRVECGFVAATAKEGFPFFISRAAGAVYQSANAIVLSALYPAQAVVGWFNASEKVLSVVRQVSSPVADSVYPYMIKQKNYKFAVKLLVCTAPFILLCCVLVFIFADDFCIFVFGDQYSSAGDLLRCLIPVMAVIFPTYIICYPILVPMGLSNYANMSTVIGMCFQLACLVILFFAGALNAYSLCLCISASEVAVFLFRLCVMLRYRDRMKEGL